MQNRFKPTVRLPLIDVLQVTQDAAIRGYRHWIGVQIDCADPECIGTTRTIPDARGYAHRCGSHRWLSKRCRTLKNISARCMSEITMMVSTQERTITQAEVVQMLRDVTRFERQQGQFK